MRKFPWLLAVLALCPPSAALAQPPILRLLERVQPVCTVRTMRDAVVLVEVVDDQAEPMEGVIVTITRRRGDAKPAQVLTNPAGRARFTLTVAGEIRVDAGHVGFATSRADRLRVTPGCLTAVMLPMQVVPPKHTISELLRAPGPGWQGVDIENQLASSDGPH